MVSLKSKSRIARILELIPSPEQNSISVGEIIEKGSVDKSTLMTVLELLSVLGAIKLSVHKKFEDKNLTAKSEVAFLFMNSLAVSLKENLLVVQDWEHLGIKNVTQENLLKWGTSLLMSMELNRTRLNPATKPIRNLVVSQAIIKKQSSKSSKGEFLMRFDPESGMYQFLSWQKNVSLQTEFIDPEKLIIDCVESELVENELIHQKNFEIKKIGKITNLLSISPTYGAYTNYNFHLFHIKLKLEFLNLKQNLRWITYEELLDGVTVDNHEIYTRDYLNEFNKSLSKSIDKLEYSFNKYKSVIKEELGEVDGKVIKKLVGMEESANLEFKSSLRWDYSKKQINKDLEKNIVKAIAGFMNHQGGNLIIGVDNKKEILGVENDFNGVKQSGKKNNDGYELTLRNLIGSYIGDEHQDEIRISFDTIEEKTICHIEISKSFEPIFVQIEGDSVFYLRIGNQTKPLNIKEAYAYIRKNWE